MTKQEAKNILLKFAEDNKWKSDWDGYLSGVISTFFEIDTQEEKTCDTCLFKNEVPRCMTGVPCDEWKTNKK